MDPDPLESLRRRLRERRLALQAQVHRYDRGRGTEKTSAADTPPLEKGSAQPRLRRVRPRSAE